MPESQPHSHPGHGLTETATPEPRALTDIARAIADCTACPLHEGRQRTVPGTGPADAELVIIGEGPGEHEDREGHPFVGASGQVLDRLLRSAGLRRDAVFITNVVKCRTPHNRAPRPTEIRACRPYLTEQLAALHPKVIVAMGGPALNWFRAGSRITREQGRIILHAPGQIIIPIMHPAAGMRDPRLLDRIEADFPIIGEWLQVMRATPAGDATESQESPGLPADPSTWGPALTLVEWLRTQLTQVATDRARIGEAGARHRLDTLAKLLGAARQTIASSEAPLLASRVTQTIAAGRRLSDCVPRICTGCHALYYPGDPSHCEPCLEALTALPNRNPATVREAPGEPR